MVAIRMSVTQLKDYPKALEYGDRLAKVYQNAGRPRKAAEQFAILARMCGDHFDYPNSIKYHTKAAEAYRKLGLRKEEAEESGIARRMSAHLSPNPTESIVRQKKGSQGDTPKIVVDEEAKQKAQKLEQKRQDRIRTLIEQIPICLAQERYEDLLRFYAELEELEPDQARFCC